MCCIIPGGLFSCYGNAVNLGWILYDMFLTGAKCMLLYTQGRTDNVVFVPSFSSIIFHLPILLNFSQGMLAGWWRVAMDHIRSVAGDSIFNASE